MTLLYPIAIIVVTAILGMSIVSTDPVLSTVFWIIDVALVFFLWRTRR